jgi:hypothetical protein
MSFLFKTKAQKLAALAAAKAEHNAKIDKEIEELNSKKTEEDTRNEIKAHNQAQVDRQKSNVQKRKDKMLEAEARLKAMNSQINGGEKLTEVQLEQFFRAHLKKKGANKKKKKYHVANKVLSLVAAKKAGVKTFYCVRCRARTTSATAPQRTKTRNGQPMLRGKCRRCGCKVVKFVSKRA